jgi:hypothetical protein
MPSPRTCRTLRVVLEEGGPGGRFVSFSKKPVSPRRSLAMHEDAATQASTAAEHERLAALDHADANAPGRPEGSGQHTNLAMMRDATCATALRCRHVRRSAAERDTFLAATTRDATCATALCSVAARTRPIRRDALPADLPDASCRPRRRRTWRTLRVVLEEACEQVTLVGHARGRGDAGQRHCRARAPRSSRSRRRERARQARGAWPAHEPRDDARRDVRHGAPLQTRPSQRSGARHVPRRVDARRDVRHGPLQRRGANQIHTSRCPPRGPAGRVVSSSKKADLPDASCRSRRSL